MTTTARIPAAPSRFPAILRVAKAIDTGDFSKVNDDDVAVLSPSPIDRLYRDWCREHRPEAVTEEKSNG